MPIIQSRLNIHHKIGYILWCFLEDLVRVDNASLEMVGVGVFGYDYSAAVLEFVVLEAGFVLVEELDVFVEEADVVLVEVFVLVVVFLF